MKRLLLAAATVLGIGLMAVIAFPVGNGYNQVHILSELYLKFEDMVTMDHGLNVTGGLYADTFTGTCTNCSCTTNLTGDVNVSGQLSVFGNAPSTTYYGVDNVRIGMAVDTPRVIWENDNVADNAWVIDNGGEGFRFFKLGSTNVPFRVNGTGIRTGSSGFRSDIWMWGTLYTFDPAGGGGNIVANGFINATGDESIGGNLDVQGNFTGNQIYGGMFNFTDAGWTLNIPNHGVYYNVTGLVPGLSNGINFIGNASATDGSTLKITVSGVYHITATLSAKAGAQGEYGVGISQNYNNPEASEKTSKCYSRFTGTGSVQTASVTCFRRLTAGDRITMIVDDEFNPSQSISIQQVNVNLVRIGS